MSEQRALVATGPSELMDFSPDYIKHQLAKVVKLMDDVLQRGDDGNGDYGIIPGTKKPTLFKPGAEKLCMMFRLAPRYKIEREYDGNHLTVTSICELYHIPTDALMGSGIGLCSSKESKYAYRQQNKVCPKCNKEAVFKSKPPKGGWYCWSKKGGCGAQFGEGDKSIEGQASGRIGNEDIADQHNTVVKMACKRAYLDATLKATAASSIFTQDQDDSDELRELRTVNEQEPPPPSQAASLPGKAEGSQEADSSAWFRAATKNLTAAEQRGPEALHAWWFENKEGNQANCSKPEWRSLCLQVKGAKERLGITEPWSEK